MILTESQAREKWCPFSRVVEAGGPVGIPAYNRAHHQSNDAPVSYPAGGLCLGSKCMAWRFERFPVATTGNTELRSDRGYCGLAGDAC